MPGLADRRDVLPKQLAFKAESSLLVLFINPLLQDAVRQSFELYGVQARLNNTLPKGARVLNMYIGLNAEIGGDAELLLYAWVLFSFSVGSPSQGRTRSAR